MKNNIKYLIIFLLVSCILIGLIPSIKKFINGTKTIYNKDYELLVKKLEHKNDSLRRINSELMANDVILSIKIDSLSRKLSLSKEKIIYINNKRNEKISVINDMPADSLFEFFSNIKTNYTHSR